MSLTSDLKILYHMILRPIRGKDHAARMESFYAGQADAYDDFRKRLLKGREEMVQSVDIPDGGVWVDLGGGTGSNLEYIAEKIPRLKKVYVVDLAGSLLERCRQRAKDRGWTNVEAVEFDACKFRPAEGYADAVTFSYSLTMIPDWFAAIDNAQAILRPGGQIGVADFFVSRKHPTEGFRKHSGFTRNFWPVWFGGDNVFPTADHVPYLHHHFEQMKFRDDRTRPPYMPVIKVPYYIFVGRKRETA